MTLKRRLSAFTLVELLIVIAILAVLAGILFTVFAPAKEKARQTQCISNLKQVGMAVLLYRQDYDGQWPASLRHVYAGYVSSHKMLVCPDDGTSEAQRAEQEAATHAPYCSYDASDGLPRISGARVAKLLAQQDVSCDELATAILYHRLADRLPLTACIRHVAPGAPDIVAALTDDFLRGDDRSVLLVLEQDGRVRILPIGPREMVSIESYVPGVTTEEWLQMLAEVKDQLRRQGFCEED